MIDLSSWMEADILSLGMAADEARRAAHGSVATYLRVYDATLADISGGAAAIPPEAGEIRLAALPESLTAAAAQVAALKAVAGGRPIAAFSMDALEQKAAAGWGSLGEILKVLVDAGLSDVADFPLDHLTDAAAALGRLQQAGARPRRLTVRDPLGERRPALLETIRACRRAVPGPLYVAPLPRQAPVDKPTTGYEDLRMVALTRLVLSDEEQPARSFVEVDWTLYGPKLAQVALTFGADHLDSVPAFTDAAMGPRRTTIADVERNIRAAGFEPRELRLPA